MADQSGLEIYGPKNRSPANPPSPEELNATFQRIASTSLSEIDRIIRDLKQMRELMRNERERVRGEFDRYASLGDEAAMKMQVLAESINDWLYGSDRLESPSASQHYKQHPVEPAPPATMAQPDLVATLPYSSHNDAMRQQPWMLRRRIWNYSIQLANAVYSIVGEHTVAAVYQSTSSAIARWPKYSHSVRAPLSAWISAFGRISAD
jgi:hypothetical protein